jgi:hypothetical protein
MTSDPLNPEGQSPIRMSEHAISAPLHSKNPVSIID